jgi:hypothetical protein
MYHTPLPDACLEDVRKQARDLLDALRNGEPVAFERFQRFDPLAGLLKPTLADALYVIAREYGYSSWEKLKERLEGRSETT